MGHTLKGELGEQSLAHTLLSAADSASHDALAGRGCCCTQGTDGPTTEACQWSKGEDS